MQGSVERILLRKSSLIIWHIAKVPLYGRTAHPYVVDVALWRVYTSTQ